MQLDIISRSKLWFGISLAILVLAVAALIGFGLKLGIDFTGGSLLQVDIPQETIGGLPTEDAVRQALSIKGFEVVVQSAGGSDYFVRFGPVTEEEHAAVLAAIKDIAPESIELKFDSVGPVIGGELKGKSMRAVVVMLVLISAYVAWAFRKVSEPVASWKYGLVTMVAAFHDVIIPLGAFAVLGHFLGYEIDTAFIAAILTVLGYSINDTIVVLDRTRENLIQNRHSDRSFASIVNAGVVQTLGRSLNTTLTTLLPLLAIVILGGETTRPFALALMIGIASGAYSSIFVASPLLVWLEKRG